MLQEAIDLQQGKVSELVRIINEKDEVTFRAPTGSGKTRMMADFMNRILVQNSDVVFLVSSLSKGDLAEQNYKQFKECSDGNIYPNLNPYMVSSESSNEERLFIPEDYNVYVLPRDLYKDKSKLKDGGVLLNFLQQMTLPLFGKGMCKKIWLIKDECHQATNNLDDLKKSFFTKVINFSATPNLSRRQHVDVNITDKEAEAVKLIKRVELDTEEKLDFGERGRHPETAIKKFVKIKENYRNLLGVNPCLIIQISNKDKAEQEWANIKRILNETEFQGLKWMSIVDKKAKCETNDKLCKLGVDRWKDYAKDKHSTIDIIIFKMVISEGWDIPRACMLYQVRDTQSKQLDEQVMGRVRRNPRLTDFETLSQEAQELALTAWVWGIEPKDGKKIRPVSLFGNADDIPQAIKVKTTKLEKPTECKDFDLTEFLKEQKEEIVHRDIFSLYNDLQRSNDIRELCYEFAKNDAQKWWHFAEHVDAIRKKYDERICSKESVKLVMDEGVPREVSFPIMSVYLDNDDYNERISDWVWKRNDGQVKFAFDSYAEKEWVGILKDVSDHISSQETGARNAQAGQMRTDNTVEPKRKYAERKKLWGKNYPNNSEIHYEYYLNGIHQSYPDFVMKDNKGQIHLFEIKSVNVSNKATFDTEEYKEKIRALKLCYKYCSEVTGHIFYLPVLKDDKWQITRFINGDETTLSEETFLESFE
ncbi:DEAD/DEAH box helicase family protein [Fibrobacter sp.]|uniref:DEAD/DEAH box helicase n=1 Tax=Fibrobacter sp. TaxID=35828 RepID=UPI0025B857A8|nr:DEAD/DEAH box helicase family protein [Fibrobacter sp.]MBR4007927.1 DEAD/DEAH box helicase family protein [Fibrobacter sp.]